MYSLYTPVQVLLEDWATGKPPQVLERLQVYFEGLCLGDVIEIRQYFEYVPHNQDSILLYSFLENKVVPVLADMDREKVWKAEMENRPSVTIEDGRIDLHSHCATGLTGQVHSGTTRHSTLHRHV